MSLTALLTILYIVVVLAVGYMTTRRKGGGAEEFFVSGRNLPWILLAPLLMAEYISGGTTVGVAEKVHQSGITNLLFFCATPIGLTVLAFGLTKFYHSIRKVTIVEVFGTLFDLKTRRACAVIMLVFFTISTGTAPLALAVALAPMLGISYESAIWVSAVFLTFMALLGLRGQAWMNVIHLAAILVCFIPLALGAASASGGWGKIAAAVPPGHLNLMAAGLPTVVAWLISIVLLTQTSPTATTAIFAAKSDTEAKMACVSTGLLVVAFTFLPSIVGLAAYVLTPGIASRHALWEVSAHLGEWATIMASIGVMAAIVSTTPAFNLILGTMFARDILLPLKPNLSDRMQILACRCAVVVIGLFGTVLGIIATEATGGILAWVFKSVQIRAIMVVPLLVSVLWRRINPTVALLTIITGVATGIMWLVAGSPFGVDVLWAALGVGLLTLIIGSLLAKPAHFKGVAGLVPAPAPDRSK